MAEDRGRSRRRKKDKEDQTRQSRSRSRSRSPARQGGTKARTQQLNHTNEDNLKEYEILPAAPIVKIKQEAVESNLESALTVERKKPKSNDATTRSAAEASTSVETSNKEQDEQAKDDKHDTPTVVTQEGDIDTGSETQSRRSHSGSEGTRHRVGFEEDLIRQDSWSEVSNGKARIKFVIHKKTSEESINSTKTTHLISAILQHFRDNGFSDHVLRDLTETTIKK